MNEKKEWFLEINQNKEGPYSASDINQLLKDKKITLETKITSESLNNTWMTIKDFSGKNSKNHDPHALTPEDQTLISLKEPTSFGLPSVTRPSFTESTGGSNPLPTGDATHALFDSFQKAKKRREDKIQKAQLDSEENNFLPGEQPLLSPKMVRLGGLSFLSSILLFGLFTFLDQSEKNTQITQKPITQTVTNEATQRARIPASNSNHIGNSPSSLNSSFTENSAPQKPSVSPIQNVRSLEPEENSLNNEPPTLEPRPLEPGIDPITERPRFSKRSKKGSKDQQFNPDDYPDYPNDEESQNRNPAQEDPSNDDPHSTDRDSQTNDRND